MHRGVLAGIIVGSVALLAGFVVVVVLGAQLVSGAVTTATSGPPLVEGEPANAVAAEPLECSEQCFTEATVGLAISSDSDFRALGVPEYIDEYGDFDSSTAATEHQLTRADWREFNLDPDECFFSYFASPVAIPLDGYPTQTDDDLIEFTATQTDETELSTLWQSVRVLDSSESAERHMRSLNDQIAGCSSYTGDGYPVTTVTPEPALDLPSSVAAIGWAESSPGWRYYVFDVQRGNMVVRSILSTPTPTPGVSGSGISEQRFRDFVEALADDVAAIEPGAGLETTSGRNP